MYKPLFSVLLLVFHAVLVGDIFSWSGRIHGFPVEGVVKVSGAKIH